MNSFSSVDVERLSRELDTRRSEVEALQEVVRLLAPAHPRDTALLIAVASILRARFGVKRLAYLHTFTSDKRPKLSYFHNFPSISRDALEEAMRATSIYFPSAAELKYPYPEGPSLIHGARFPHPPAQRLRPPAAHTL